MKSERSYSGWTAALTVTITLTLSLLAVEKHLANSGNGLWRLAFESEYFPWFLSPRGEQRIELAVRLDRQESPGKQSSDHLPNRICTTTLSRKRYHGDDFGASKLLRRPPEPASGAILREPLTPEDFVALPLTQGSSSLGMLMESMNAALESPLKMVSLSTNSGTQPEDAVDSQSVGESTLRPTLESLSRFPLPTTLLSELDEVQAALETSSISNNGSSLSQSDGTQGPHYVGTLRSITAAHFAEIENWTIQTRRLLHRLTSEQSLSTADITGILGELQQLSSHSIALGDQLQSDQLAQTLIRTGYSLRRRVDVWNAVQSCLDSTNTKIQQPQSAEQSKTRLVTAIDDVSQLVGLTVDGKSWRSFLLLDELHDWAQSPDEVWRASNTIAKKYLTRVQDAQLTDLQHQFLQQKEIALLTGILANWNQDPVDYHHLLVSLEQVEQSGQSRTIATIAESLQALRLSENVPQQRLAETLNGHYRNANLRLTISQELVERFLPQGQHEIRPIRQTILGARTSGDSSVQTRLSVKFHDDVDSWNIELGVVGDVVSNTSSSKGPAVFHNTGIAQVQSQRYLKIGPKGYAISSAPTAVASQDFLNRLSTDFDGLPIIGEFARLIAREQFNQKRGVAKRITQRKIAQETDTELDKKLESSLKQYEQQLEERILGPLSRLRLDPHVMSMSTTSEKLAIRYRLAHSMQLAAFTPRPRAPAASLVSFQLHQSALNNTLDRIGLSGRSWTLPELYAHIGSLVRTTMTPPVDVPDDISVRFADRNPISFEMVDGHLRLHLRIAEFKRQEGLQVRNFVVTSTYVPLADGLDAGLIRDPDGVIEIQGKNLAIRDRLALRVIFAKVFVSQPKISLISQQWQADPKAKGLAISQLEVRDGWLAVALSAADNAMATEVAERTRQIKARLRSADGEVEPSSEFR